MTYHQQCFSHFTKLFKFTKAFCLEENVSDGKCLIDNEDLRLNINGNGKSQTDEHTAGIRLYRLIHEFTDICKTQDIIHSGIDFLSGKSIHGSIQINILNSGVLSIETGSQFQQCGNSSVYIHLAFCRIQNTGNNFQHRGFSGTVRTDNADGFSTSYMEADIPQCIMFAIQLLFGQSHRFFEAIRRFIIQLIQLAYMIHGNCVIVHSFFVPLISFFPKCAGNLKTSGTLFLFSLKDICKMYFQTFEDNGADSEQCKSDDPEIDRQIEMLKKPHLVDQTVTVTLYNIIERIQLQQF